MGVYGIYRYMGREAKNGPNRPVSIVTIGLNSDLCGGRYPVPIGAGEI